MKTRTATSARAAASIAALAGATLIMSSCGGSDAEGVYQNNDADGFVVIDNEDITYLEPYKTGHDDLKKTFDVLEDGKIPSEDYITDVETGHLNEAHDTILWDDDDPESIRVDEDMIQLGEDTEDTYVPFDSDQATDAREEALD